MHHHVCFISGKNADAADLSGVIASEADFSNANLKEVTMSKAYARNSKFDGADFTNAVVDRVSFDGSSMRGAIFKVNGISHLPFPYYCHLCASLLLVCYLQSRIQSLPVQASKTLIWRMQ
jgi:hypothetical protein